LDRLIVDAELRTRIGDAARKRFEELFSLDATAAELARLLIGLTETSDDD
jgi:glycosyltransferase involved in cell wall biosynthesis